MATTDPYYYCGRCGGKVTEGRKHRCDEENASHLKAISDSMVDMVTRGLEGGETDHGEPPAEKSLADFPLFLTPTERKENGHAVDRGEAKRRKVRGS